jgi:SpoVK/Ycf46/Vps4 family AAA+-type ATPase
MKQLYQTPILSRSIHNQINDAITGFTHRRIWHEWGLDKLREQGVAILLHGAPGTGKTITAYFVAKKLHVGIREISMADFGSQIPGQLARNIVKIFAVEQVTAKAEHKHYPVILLDECDAMLVSRDRLGPNMVWMLEPINMLLSQIAKYPGLVILATNHVHILDWALERRLLAKIKFDRPEFYERLVMWKTKFPDKFPVQPTEEEYRLLANEDLTGAEIESDLLLWAGQQVRNETLPTDIKIKDLIEFIKLGHESYYNRQPQFPASTTTAPVFEPDAA